MMSKRIIVSEWEVEPRVYGLDEFIAAQTLDAEEKALGFDDGQMLDSEVEQLNAMQVGQRIRIGDPDCTEIYVERINDTVPEYQLIDGVTKLDGPVIMEISEEVYEKLSDYASDRNISLDEALVAAVNRNDVVLRNQSSK
jgi:hypothetical protein